MFSYFRKAIVDGLLRLVKFFSNLFLSAAPREGPDDEEVGFAEVPF